MRRRRLQMKIDRRARSAHTAAAHTTLLPATGITQQSVFYFLIYSSSTWYHIPGEYTPNNFTIQHECVMRVCSRRRGRRDKKPYSVAGMPYGGAEGLPSALHWT